MWEQNSQKREVGIGARKTLQKKKRKNSASRLEMTESSLQSELGTILASVSGRGRPLPERRLGYITPLIADAIHRQKPQRTSIYHPSISIRSWSSIARAKIWLHHPSHRRRHPSCSACAHCRPQIRATYSAEVCDGLDIQHRLRCFQNLSTGV